MPARASRSLSLSRNVRLLAGPLQRNRPSITVPDREFAIVDTSVSIGISRTSERLHRRSIAWWVRAALSFIILRLIRRRSTRATSGAQLLFDHARPISEIILISRCVDPRIYGVLL